MLQETDELTIIGGKEKVNFPEINMFQIVARIDTGAKTSSIHCEKVWVERIKNRDVLCARLLKRSKEVKQFKKFRIKTVKSSNGAEQVRYAIRLSIQVGDKLYRTEFTLSNRDKMSYPVLLGRKFLRKKFIVDVSHEFLLSSANRIIPEKKK